MFTRLLQLFRLFFISHREGTTEQHTFHAQADLRKFWVRVLHVDNRSQWYDNLFRPLSGEVSIQQTLYARVRHDSSQIIMHMLANVMGSSMASGKPLCPCGRSFLTTLDPGLRVTWVTEERQKWAWGAGSLAYGFLCHTCHQKEWPGDQRCKGPYCRPGLAPWARRGTRGRLSLVCGDFYDT
jgi:hypothetical protein